MRTSQPVPRTVAKRLETRQVQTRYLRPMQTRTNSRPVSTYNCQNEWVDAKRYYHYMGSAKKSINIFYSLNKVTYSPRYACADWEESNIPPNIYVWFLSARIQSTEDFRFLTSFCASSAKFCHTGSHDGTHRKSKLQSQNGTCLKFECGCSAVQHSLLRRRLNFVTCSLKCDNLSPLTTKYFILQLHPVRIPP